jgi:glycosyltransferase involved in cell wall biosynthesis
MRILIAHNHYQQHGGEDAVFANESTLLERAGHDVHRYEIHNDTISGLPAKAQVFLKAPYSSSARRRFEDALDAVKPDVVHVHNYFPLMTPAVFFACSARNIPVVHTLHNFRMMCANALLLREGKVCEKCVTGSPYWAVVHRCYRESTVGSLAVARMIGAQRRWKTWHEQVSLFIVPSRFARAKFIEAGVPENRISIKPNFIPDPGVHNQVLSKQRTGVLYVGRLSQEKGLRTLIEAWRDLTIPLRIAGDGPQMDELRDTAPDSVALLGRLTSEQVYAEMARAALLVMPSNCFEGLPVTLIEALACGLPVAASRIGALQEVVLEGKTGRTFEPGNAIDLTRTMRSMLADPDGLADMSRAARTCYEENYTAATNLEMLLAIYRKASESVLTSRIEKGQSGPGVGQ